MHRRLSFSGQDSRVGPFLRGGWEQISQKPLATSGAEAKAFTPTAAWNKNRTSGQPKPQGDQVTSPVIADVNETGQRGTFPNGNLSTA